MPTGTSEKMNFDNPSNNSPKVKMKDKASDETLEYANAHNSEHRHHHHHHHHSHRHHHGHHGEKKHHSKQEHQKKQGKADEMSGQHELLNISPLKIVIRDPLKAAANSKCESNSNVCINSHHTTSNNVASSHSQPNTSTQSITSVSSESCKLVSDGITSANLVNSKKFSSQPVNGSCPSPKKADKDSNSIDHSSLKLEAEHLSAIKAHLSSQQEKEEGKCTGGVKLNSVTDNTMSSNGNINSDLTSSSALQSSLSLLISSEKKNNTTQPSNSIPEQILIPSTNKSGSVDTSNHKHVSYCDHSSKAQQSRIENAPPQNVNITDANSHTKNVGNVVSNGNSSSSHKQPLQTSKGKSSPLHNKESSSHSVIPTKRSKPSSSSTHSSSSSNKSSSKSSHHSSSSSSSKDSKSSHSSRHNHSHSSSKSLSSTSSKSSSHHSSSSSSHKDHRHSSSKHSKSRENKGVQVKMDAPSFKVPISPIEPPPQVNVMPQNLGDYMMKKSLLTMSHIDELKRLGYDSNSLDDVIDARFSKYIHVERYANGGALVVHVYHDEVCNLDKETMKEFVDHYFDLVYGEEVEGVSRCVMGIVHGAAKPMPDFLDYLVDNYPNLAVKIGSKAKSDIETSTVEKYRQLVSTNRF